MNLKTNNQGQFLGLALIEFASVAECEAAITLLHKHPLDGKSVRVMVISTEHPSHDLSLFYYSFMPSSANTIRLQQHRRGSIMSAYHAI